MMNIAGNKTKEFEGFQGELNDLLSWSGYTAKTHDSFLSMFRNYLERGERMIRQRFEEQAVPASRIISQRSMLIDTLIASLTDLALNHVYHSPNPTKGEQIAIVAVGGYGRSELAPHSDVDLLFLRPYKLTPRIEQVVEFMLYFLWDLKLTVGHATRTVDEAIRLAKDDLTICTNMLESRFITGDAALFEVFQETYATKVIRKSKDTFVEEKLKERDRRHDKMGDTRYVLEPNVKDGKGALRDLQTLYWIARYLYEVVAMDELVERDVFTAEDVRIFEKAANFLWTVRCNLHYLTAREEDRLTFDVQPDVARRMGYRDHAGARGVERFMKHYFLIVKDVGDLTRVLCAVMEEQHRKKARRFRVPGLPVGSKSVNGFALESGRLSVDGRLSFQKSPVKLLTLFQTALEHDMDIHPRAFRAARQCLGLINQRLRNDGQANAAFMQILTSSRNPEKILMSMNETGVFGRFIPDFGRVVAQMQYDMYHVYTVDEHTIRAIGILHRIEKGELTEDHPTSATVVKEIQSRRVLYLAVLLHDIAKGRKGDHSEIGADIALRLCPRLGLNDWETETVSWLVRHHLLMSRIAFKRDLDDPQTIRDFVNEVQSPERLRLLLVLTVADIRAVGPKVWNAWKASLLRDLYYRTQEAFSGPLDETRRQQRINAAKSMVRARLENWDTDWVEQFLSWGRAHYWASFSPDVLVRHAAAAREMDEVAGKPVIRHLSVPESDITEIIVYAPDHPGLFAAIAGAMALSGAAVEDARIVTFSNSMAMDTFWIQDENGSAYDEPRRLETLKKRIARAVCGELFPARELAAARKKSLASRTRVFRVPPRVICDNSISNSATVIEVNGRDRPGLLLDLTAVLTSESLQITSAHISTYGERVVDVFYVKDAFGLKVTNERKLANIQQKLTNALQPAEGTNDQAVFLARNSPAPGKPVPAYRGQ